MTNLRWKRKICSFTFAFLYFTCLNIILTAQLCFTTNSIFLIYLFATKTFFVNENGLKVNAKTYKKHLEKQLFPEVDRLMNGTCWIFLQDSAPSHRSNLVQNFLKEKLGSKFIKHTEWLPSSPDCNPLGYHFWNKIKERVYKDRLGQPLKSEDELKKKIKKVWS